MTSQYRVSIDLEQTCCDCAVDHFTMMNNRPPIAEAQDPYEAPSEDLKKKGQLQRTET